MQCPEVMVTDEDALVKITIDLFIRVRWENICEGVGRRKLALPSCPFYVEGSKYRGCALTTSAGCDCVHLLGRLNWHLPSLWVDFWLFLQQRWLFEMTSCKVKLRGSLIADFCTTRIDFYMLRQLWSELCLLKSCLEAGFVSARLSSFPEKLLCSVSGRESGPF